LWLTLVGVTSAAIFLYSTAIGDSSGRLITKIVPVLCLCLWLLPRRHANARWITMGLLLSAVGDFCLEWASSWFPAGLIAFLLAHLAYLTAYVRLVRRAQLILLVPVAAFGIASFRVLEPSLGDMTIPVALYTTVICCMLWRAWALIGVRPREPRKAWSAALGATSFALSDTLVAWNRFVEPSTTLALLLMVLYWGGQWAIAASASDDSPDMMTAGRP
ncbi:MAG: lysoplasmalogenase, partial [Verrucomicrobia bacterium]|nr:lysoplasmalogenase [Verrucomicrobiota bacterium]